MISKLVLGSAQFGLDYGINNQRGKIPEEEVFVVINKALTEGIEIIDTA
jgi:aryl-alcohol dehydrogenase-like predicted oxidoreductase